MAVIAWALMIFGGLTAAIGAYQVWSERHEDDDSILSWLYLSTYWYGLLHIRELWQPMLMWTGGMIAAVVGLSMIR